jgi:hypothetical protein
LLAAGLGQRGGTEVHSQQRDGPLLPGVADCRLAPITGLIKSRIRKSHQHGAWQPCTDVSLHLDDPPFETDQGHRPVQAGLRGGSAEYGDLVAQDEQLKVLGRGCATK